MIRRLVSMFTGGVMAVGASQAPEFAQQYTQRLGGAVDELRSIVVEFDADARRNGLTRTDGLTRLEAAADPFARERGQAQRRIIQRFDRLEAQKAAMDAPDVTSRVVAMVRAYDGEIGKGAMRDYRPAVPLSAEGLFFGLMGFLGGALAGGIVALPMGRRKGRITPRTAP
jgi:hypothetical protein